MATSFFAMNISLTPKLERFIQEKVASGLYASASEVVREALRVLEERDRIDVVRLKAMRERAAAALMDTPPKEALLEPVVELVSPLSLPNERERPRRDEP